MMVRMEVIMMSEISVFDSIESKVNNSDEAVRREAAEDLVFTEDSNAIDLLHQLLLDENKGVREAAGEALLRRGNQSGAEQLVENFANPRIEVRNQATWLLIDMGEPVLEYVFPALTHPDHDVRKFAADVIGEIGSEIGVVPLVDSIGDVDSNVGFSVVEALGKIGSDIALDELESAFKKYPNIRPTIVETLGKLKNPNAIGVVKDGLQDEDPLVVFAITEAFGEIGGEDEIAPLEKLIEESEGYIKSIAITSLIKIANKTDKEPRINLLSAPYISEFNRAAESNREVADFAKRMISELSSQSRIKELLQSFPNLNSEIKTVVLDSIREQKSDQTIEITYSALTDSSPQVKMAAIQNLSYWKEPESISKLFEVFDDEDDWVVFRAAEAIGRIGEKSSVEQLLGRIDTDKPLRQIAIIKALEVLDARNELLGLVKSKLIYDEGVKEALNEITGKYTNG